MNNIKFTDLTIEPSLADRCFDNFCKENNLYGKNKPIEIDKAEPSKMNINTLPIPTDDNYFSPEMNRLYSGSSQLKAFIECEAREMAILEGKYQKEESSEAMLQGSYIHAWSEGTLQKFIEEHPEIMASKGKNAGGLKASFQICDTVIDVLKNDKAIYSIITQCEKEFIFTGDIFGLPIKIKVDLLNKEKKYFADLKFMRNISDKTWSDDYKRKVNFILAWHYDWQMAIYCEIIKQNLGEYFTPNIIAASKEDVPDKALITFETEDENSLEDFVKTTLEEIKPHILRVKELKEGTAEPIGCGVCDYCKSIKQITEPIYWLDL
jgi:hypothetical protein